MSRIGLLLCFAIVIQAMPSWGQSDSVVQGSKEWLQPADFIGYTYEEVKAVCPGPCSGKLPGSTVDLTGYRWASVTEVNALFNAYGVSPPFSGGSQVRSEQDEAAQALFSDFEATHDECSLGHLGSPCVIAMLRLVGVGEPKATFTVLAGLFDNRISASQGLGAGVWFYRPLSRVLLEEPINEEIHSGIGNLRGWAISAAGIDRVEIYINGKYMFDAPYGGDRPDVAQAYPDVGGSDRSGFSLAFGYSNLGIGQHTVTARAFDTLGEYMESTSAFEIVAFHKDFIPGSDIVDTAQASMTTTGDEILLDNVLVDGQPYELRLKWRTAEQGFEIIEIR